MRYQRMIRNLGVGLLSGFMGAQAAADDTEIFFNIDQNESRPNILFLLDNSGSMDSEVEVEATGYDSSQDYDGDYDDDFIYYADGGYFYTIRKTVIQCSDIAGKLSSVGKTAPYRMAYYYGNEWNSFSYQNVNYSTTDCQADNDQNVDWGDMKPQEYYSANYLNWYFYNQETQTKTRLEIVQEVANNLADGLSNVNIGLMAFDTNANTQYHVNIDQYMGEGGRILVPIADVEENRQTFKDGVNALGPDTNTPLSETFFGAKRYFEGKSPFLSDADDQASDAMDGNQYDSPISLECQSNHVIVLTDGEPTKDYNHTNDMATELGIDSCDGNCLDEIADYMQNSDISDDYEGNQRVTTHTVGFLTDQELLSSTANKGGGDYYLADNADNLTAAFNTIIKEVLSTNSTFSSPGVSVNNFNQLEHLDALYFALFEPTTRSRWPGNLKRYRLKSDGTIVDQNNKDAIDDSTGFFKEGARSFWSSIDDGAQASVGGVAGQLPDDNSQRKVYTYYSGSTSKVLSDPVNAVTTANSNNLTKTMFGDANMSDADHNKLIKWTRGVDVNDVDQDGNHSDSRHYIADPLHSRPDLQVYGGTEADPDTTVFFGDNQGYLHAIDGETGVPHFSFIPEAMLANQSTLLSNDVTDAMRPYGMDGSVTSWFADKDGNNAVNGEDHVYIYSGMRRGGRNYYGLDVTDRSAPELLWTIKGGEGDFSELGQSWSQPVKEKVRIGDAVEDVLIISGGYDPDQDDVNTRTEDDQGRAIYIVDASTGDRLWWAGPEGSGADLVLDDMDYSIPATPAVIDVNGDDLADQIYVGDMGGQVWRVDFAHGKSAANFATAGVIADLAGDSVATNRRFYHTPDLSGTLKDGKRQLNLVIGSGFQAHPLDTGVEDRLYKLDVSSIVAPTDDDGNIEYTTLTEDDLYDTTDNLIQQGSDAQKETAETNLADGDGWYIRFTRSGEKVLSSSATLRGDVYITTYEPSDNLDPCVPAAGQARLYHVKLRDGRAVVNYDGVGGDEALTKPDREKTLKTTGLPPSPKSITIEGEEIIVTGSETTKAPPPKSLVRKIYWYEE
ncbi:pilus assembly protein PilY [Tamilnaduibacter salinus]|uniref:Pilus assembly protein PilY n=1 Tax=Tamilnaduibacter salinus TaxID=1484056 RepID=A0A2A2I204_9GAMM|nr:PilC/PilY family type IV pilus protein [Tamilnaduibacter salinus]PAV25165.1 pilus assembly protein PilY [Tamilnaduibacter salinus]